MDRELKECLWGCIISFTPLFIEDVLLFGDPDKIRADKHFAVWNALDAIIEFIEN